MLPNNTRPLNVKQNRSLPLYRCSEFLGCTLIALLVSSSILQAEEIRYFKVVNVDGLLSLKFISDNQKIVSHDISTQRFERRLWQEELSLKVNSYVYHPNFLKIDFGAGLLADQTRFDSSTYSYKINQSVNNLSARLDFLPKKPTPFSVYYNKRNTTVPIGSAGSFLLENIKYGSEIALLSPLSPVTMKLSNYRETTYGVGANQITDDMNEQTRLSMSYPYGVGTYLKLSHQNNDRISRSGSLSLAIVEKEYSTSSTGIDTRNTFGVNHQIRLSSNLGQQKQKGFPERETWFFRPNLDWKHNKKFTSYYSFATNHTKEQDRETENNKTSAKLNYSGDNSLAGAINLSINNSKSTGFEFEDKAVGFSLAKKINATYGKYNVSYNASINTRDQTSTLNLIPVFDDEYIFSGITQIIINQDDIDTSNPITVTNLTQTQTYIEGTDYTITTIGNQTLIERLIAGNIADGQSILIDYRYQTGGTIKYDRLTQGLNVNLSIGKHYNLSTRFYESKQILKDGIPTTNLNSSNGAALSLRVNRPLKKGVAVGGELIAQQHNEESNPYNKQSIDAFINLPLPKTTKLKINTGLLKIDNKNSDEDADKKILGLHIRSSLWLRTSTTFDSQYSQDTGGSTKRTFFNNKLDFGWSYRRLNLKASLKHQSEEQGIIERDDWSIYMKLQRAF